MKFAHRSRRFFSFLLLALCFQLRPHRHGSPRPGSGADRSLRPHRPPDRGAVRGPRHRHPRAHPRQHAHHRRPALQPGQRGGRHPQPLRHGRHHQRAHLQRAGRASGVKVIVIVATKSITQGRRFPGQRPHQGRRLQQEITSKKGGTLDEEVVETGPPEAPGLLPRQGLQRRRRQEQHRHRRSQQLGHGHLLRHRRRHAATSEHVFFEGNQAIKSSDLRHAMKGTRGKDILSRSSTRAAGSTRPSSRKTSTPSATSTRQGLHRHRHPRDPHPAAHQRRHQPRHRRARGAAVPRRHPQVRGHAGVHRHGNPPLPQDEGGCRLLAQGPEGRPQDHRGLLRLARLRGHARHPRGPARRGQPGQPALQDRRGRPVLRRARQHRGQHPDQGQGHPPGNPPRPRRHLQHRARRGRQEAAGKPRLL